MPGRLLSLTPTLALGWAVHPRLVDYRVLVNVVHRSTVIRSVLAETVLAGEQTKGPRLHCGFSIGLTRLGVTPADVARLRFSIGETDEWIERPEGAAPPEPTPLTVEDILVQAHRPRAWVTGVTYLDAQAAGLRVGTIVDLLYRDYLGRPSDPNGLAHYVEAILAGTTTYDDIRRSFVEADEFRLRRKYIDNAPGSIFSQRMVMDVASLDAGQHAPPLASGLTVAASDLLRLEGAEFVTALYRGLLLKEPDEGGMAHYLHQLHLGVGKVAIIRTIAGELEAITAGVRVIGLPETETVTETETEPVPGGVVTDTPRR